jgi:ABC-type uncharacterized transport system involved in gliding motility auxiliary subunit
MNRIDSRGLALIAIAVAATLFVAVNVVSNAWLGNARVDVTQGRAYSTSDQIKPVFANIGEPITVRVYYSRAIGDLSPRHAVFYQRVRSLLEQYAKLANGKLIIEFYNPEPFSDVEDRAVGFGLQGVPLGQANEVGYFGLAASNSTDDEQVIPFFNLEREQFLEYDLTKLIYSLSEPNRPKVGLITSLQMNSGGAPQSMPQGMAPGQSGPWAIMQQIKDFFTVVELGADTAEIPKDVGILFLVQPQNLTGPAQYAIDQFVLRGGRALVFVDPNPESASPMAMGGMQQQPTGAGDLSGIKKLMAAWGVSLADKQVVGDREAAMRVNMSTGSRPVVSDYVAWIQLRRDNFDSSDAATGDLKQVNFGTAGALDKVEGAGTMVTPLITTGPQSMRMDAEKFVGMPDVVSLFRDFKPQNKRETLAVRITGKAKSAFPAAMGPGEYLPAAKDSIQVIVVADTDVLTDRFWTESNSFLNQQIVVPTADNGNFVINTLENLTGAPALSSLRGRGVQSRPFLLVDEIRRDAEVQYRAKEQSLTGRLSDLEKKVNAMQPRSDEKGAAVLSDQDKKTIESYRSDILATRKELRDVQRALRENIDALEGVVKFVNIAAVPIVFGLILIVTAYVRHRRRKRRAAEA